MKVIICEDDAAIHELLKIMVQDAGHQVVGGAYNGPESVSLACQLQPDAVLLDVVMPNPTTGQEDRLAGLKAAKEILTCCPLPIVMITAYESEDLLAQASQIGIGALLVKPPRRGEIDRSLTIARARFSDLMELRRINAVLKEREERSRIILQTAMDGFWRFDQQLRLLEVNETYCHMSGYSEAELLGMRVTDLEAIETAAETATHLQKVLTHGEDRFESKHRRKDGSLFLVEISVQYKVVGEPFLVAFLRDITKKKSVEEAMSGSL